MPTTWTLAGLRLTDLGETRPIEGQPVGGTGDVGTAALYEVTGPDDLWLTLGDRRWRSGPRDLSTLESHSSPERFDRLKHGLRMSVMPHAGGASVKLRQARIQHGSASEHSNLFKATLADLDAGAGVSITQVLDAYGAHVGTREALLRETNNRRKYLCAVFPTDDSPGLVSTYVLTRVLPLLNRVTA